MTALAGFDGHQGIGLVVRPRVWGTIDAVLARAAERGEPPFVLVLDSLEDPQNFGTLLRSAEAAGVHGVIFPTHHQAPLSPAAVKASAGATEHLLLVPVDDLAASLADLHVRGLRMAGSEADAPLTARQADLRGPLALVVGSEGQGLGPAIRRRCDLLLRIPMRGAIGSLNASVAGSILLFEALEQRGLPEAPVETAARLASAGTHDRGDRADRARGVLGADGAAEPRGAPSRATEARGSDDVAPAVDGGGAARRRRTRRRNLAAERWRGPKRPEGSQPGWQPPPPDEAVPAAVAPA